MNGNDLHGRALAVLINGGASGGGLGGGLGGVGSHPALGSIQSVSSAEINQMAVDAAAANVSPIAVIKPT